jgi:phenylalanyl-tRNA synthetase beta chain
MLPRGSGRLMTTRGDAVLEAQDTARTALIAAGFDEAVNMGFISPRELGPFDDDGKRFPRMVLRNPLSEDVSVMRSTLLPGLLRNVVHNQRHGEHEVRLFEMGTVFQGPRPEGHEPRPQSEDGAQGGDAYAVERVSLGLVMTGTRGPSRHQARQAPELDFYDLKGSLEEILDAMGLHTDLWRSDVRMVPAPAASVPFLHPGMAASVMHQGVSLGIMGALHPRLAKQLEAKGRVLVAEVDLTAIAQRLPSSPVYAPIARFPAVRRDLSALLDEATTVEQLFSAVRATAPSQDGLVETVELFDLYRDDKLPPGKKSVGISLTFRSAEKTLTDERVNTLHQAVMSAVERDLKAEVRKA